jgi:hypothetical protein
MLPYTAKLESAKNKNAAATLAHRHGRAMRAGHLGDKGGLDHLGAWRPSMNAKLAFTAISQMPPVRQPCRRN